MQRLMPIIILFTNYLTSPMDYELLSYRDLQTELKKRNLKASGKKNELVARLEESDQNGYVDLAAEELEEEMNATSKHFHVRTMIGQWYDVRLNNDQTIADLLSAISDRTGAPTAKIILSTQEGMIVNSDFPVRSFAHPDVFLNMMIRLR